MPKRKVITCICHGPIAAGPHYKSPWEDVWLRWKGKPGRKKYYAAPTLECAAEILSDLKIHEDIRAKKPKAASENWYAEDDRVLHQALKDLETQPFAIDTYKREPGNYLESVYTKANGIDRREAEKMLAFYLEKKFGIRNPKFRWKKPGMIIQPMGFGDYS